MASNNIQMPLFAPSSQQDGGGGWNEVDHFDVDILAEYLLGDGSLPSTGGGVTFDFMYVPVRCCWFSVLEGPLKAFELWGIPALYLRFLTRFFRQL